MQWIGKQLVCRGLLNNLAGIHHRHVVTGLRDHAEIVGDQHNRRAEPLPKIGEQLEDLGLDRDIERCCWLVGNHQRRLTGQGHRDHHPLPHAARELMGILVDPLLGVANPHKPEHLESPCPGFRP